MSNTSAVQFEPAIVIADDEEHDVFLIKRILQNAGAPSSMYTLTEGHLVKEFLASPAGAKVKLLFLDVRMPVVDGFAVLEWVKSQPALKNLKVVMLSGSEKPEDVARAKQLGAERYLIKFPPTEQFTAILKEML